MKHEISQTAQERAGSTQGAKPATSVALSAPNALGGRAAPPWRKPAARLEAFTQDEIDSGLARVALALPAEVETMVRGLTS